MENEIETAAKSYFEENDSPFGEPNYPIQPAFRSGARWMLEQYNGVSPDTVKELIETLRKIQEYQSILITGSTKSPYRDRIYGVFIGLKDVLSKVDKP